ncbi:MAG TPA: hypothetical protein VE860_21160 [Chthoniobacterales bacterium]|nr:hypothetical protein [Chthoniobacterales bacterium]
MSNKLTDPEDYPFEEDEEETIGSIKDPLAEPPGSRGRKAINPYEGTEADDNPGPSIADEMEEHTPAADEQLEGGEEL